MASNDFTSTILEDALKLTHGPRNNTYGHPLDDWGFVAKMWTMMLQKKGLIGDGEIDATTAAMMMLPVKISRELNAHQKDNFVDIAGYAFVGDECWEEANRRGQPVPPKLTDEEIRGTAFYDEAFKGLEYQINKSECSYQGLRRDHPMFIAPARNGTYVAGPMKGIEDYNYPTFNSIAYALEGNPERWGTIYNPAHMDLSHGYSLEDIKAMTPEEFDSARRRFLTSDIEIILNRCKRIVMLPGWESSTGAQAEYAAAKAVGLDVYLAKLEGYGWTVRKVV